MEGVGRQSGRVEAWQWRKVLAAMKSNLKLYIAASLTEIARHFSSWHVSNHAVRAVNGDGYISA